MSTTEAGNSQQEYSQAAVEGCEVNSLALADGLSVLWTRYRPPTDLVEDSVKRNPERTLVITVGLQGESGYASSDGTALKFKEGYTTISTFRDSAGKRHFRGAAETCQLRVQIGEELLRRYLGEQRCDEVLGAGEVRQLIHRPTLPSTLVAAQAIAGCTSKDTRQCLAAHIHALTVLANELERFERPPGRSELHFTDADLARIEAARNLLSEKLSEELTVPYVAHSVGLNEFKLKAGFRYCFNTSPYQMLLELRMRHARHLLEQTDSQVAQVAYAVGYRHPSNFSAAFTKFFGVSPKKVGSRAGTDAAN